MTKEEKKSLYQRKRYNDLVIKRTSTRYPKGEQHFVYALPEEGYVGVTKNIKNRMAKHRKDYGRNTDGMYVLRVCDSKDEAILWEHRYQAKGWGGARSKNYYDVKGARFNSAHHYTLETGTPLRSAYRLGVNIPR